MRYEIYQEKNIKINKSNIEKIINSFANLFKISNNTHLSISFVGPTAIKKLNNQYRKINKITDVLSFGYIDKKIKIPKKLIFFEQDFLGEIIICFSQAVTQAKNNNQKIDDEINKLLAHGLVHLVGYDHKLDKDWKDMQQVEKLILSIIYK